jgi:phosphate starvation-inducible membrane PsiE
MHDGEATLAWVLFWVFTAITTVATFLITDHHQSRLRAWVFSAFSLVFFIALFIAMQVLFRYLGL